jgi:hypothetical protein
MLTASSATGQLLFLPLLASLTDRFGWRIALGFVCVMLLVAKLASDSKEGQGAFTARLSRDRPYGSARHEQHRSFAPRVVNGSTSGG